jgi:hypothetical protein
MFSAVKLLKQEVYFRDKERGNHICYPKILVFFRVFVSLLLYIIQYFVVKIDIIWFLSDEFSYLTNGALFCI